MENYAFRIPAGVLVLKDFNLAVSYALKFYIRNPALK